jgi:hypothetical protein
MLKCPFNVTKGTISKPQLEIAATAHSSLTEKCFIFISTIVVTPSTKTITTVAIYQSIHIQVFEVCIS